MKSEATTKETEAALDAICRLALLAREKGVDRAAIATTALSAAFALYRHIHGPEAAPDVARLTRALCEIEAARINGADFRIFGEARGRA